MEVILKVTGALEGTPKVDVTHNPGRFAAPLFVIKDEAYYFIWENEDITSGLVQSNGHFEDLIFNQLDYDSGGIIVRFVNIHKEKVLTNFTLQVTLKKVERELDKPSALLEAMKAGGYEITKDRH